MNPKFPYDLSRVEITQKFHSNHNGWDIVPLYKRFNGLPADCYPVFPGKTLSVADVNNQRGRGIKVRTQAWHSIKEYLKSFGIETEYIDTLYWHFLDVTDEDGYVDTNTPVGITGNTGNVWSGGVAVPDSMKGVPPYPGLHLHIEFKSDDNRFIDPEIIFNFKEKEMQLVNDSGVYYLEGNKGKIGIADPKALEILKMLTDEEVSRPSVGVEVAVFEKSSASLTLK